MIFLVNILKGIARSFVHVISIVNSGSKAVVAEQLVEPMHVPVLRSNI
jgi:hypothetical protein